MKSKITTIEAAFKAEGLDINKLPEVSHLENEKDRNAVVDNYTLDIVIRALNNEGQEKKWEADYSDYSQDKYENVYYHSASGWSLGSVVGYRCPFWSWFKCHDICSLKLMYSNLML